MGTIQFALCVGIWIHLFAPSSLNWAFYYFAGIMVMIWCQLILDCEEETIFYEPVQFPGTSTESFIARYRNRSRPMYFGGFPIYHILPSGDREGGARRHNLSILGPIPEQ